MVKEAQMNRNITWNKIWRRIREAGVHQWSRLLLNAKIKARGQLASDRIRSLIEGPHPALICRLGTGELYAMVDYRAHLENRKTYDPEDYAGLEKIAGFFPVRQDLIGRYYERMLSDIQIADLLGSWIDEERHFAHELRGAVKVPLPDLEPYFHSDPWSSSLEGRKVLVVNPFAKTIEAQYRRRGELFADRRVLPDFTLKTIRSVQSIGSIHGRREYADWFQALQSMEDQISAADFDVAIIGCGAYGLPLAAHVKRLGKKAVHLGGATQILFGVKGKRWENIPSVARLFNDAWVRPSTEDRPDNYQEIEGGSYW